MPGDLVRSSLMTFSIIHEMFSSSVLKFILILDELLR